MDWMEINKRYVYPAISAWRAGRIEEAEALFKEGLAITGGDGNVALKYAEFLEDCRLLKDAEEMYRIALRKLPKPEFKRVAQEGLSRVSHPKHVSVDYGKLADYIVKEFNVCYHKEYVEYFARMGFSRETILDPSILFRFMSVISYDMRPLSYRQVWGPPNHCEFDNNSVKQALEQLGLDLTSVREMEEETLRQKLRSRELKLRNDIFRMDVHDWKERGCVDHATGLKDLANNVDTIARLFRDLATSRDITEIYDAIRSIRGARARTSIRRRVKATL
jgi:tetratricopeptide (TPR) repeat protein